MSQPRPVGSDSWPAWATEAVVLVDHDPAWVRLAARERDLLSSLLQPWLTGRIEHVGSTAVPGLTAKPIIDLQAPIDDLDDADAITSIVAPHDWHYVPPELDQRPFRRFFVKARYGRRVAHLHLMRSDDDRWRKALAFRDALRADPALVDAYARFKTGLNLRYPGDRETYSINKRQFIDDALRRGEG